MNIKKRLRTALAPIIVLATIGAFSYYLRHHPETIAQLRQLSPLVILALLGLYAVAFVAYALITRISLRIYGKTMSGQENVLFNAYSSLVNFFGPGQSGPVFRGAYLKKRHNLSVKQFMFTMLLYLGFYAVISAMLVLVGSRQWWQILLVMLAVAAMSIMYIRRYQRRSHIEINNGLTVTRVGFLFGATALQITVLAVIYGIELYHVGVDASVNAVLAYTGISNFSLFVALTPGAIGIREAFLVFSQSVHHINASSIVAANVIDRAVYLVFLGLLFVLVLATHARDKLHVASLKVETKADDQPDRV